MDAAPRHILLELDDDDDRSIASASSAALGIESSATSFSTAARGDLRSAVVAPDLARAPTEATSKFWGVCWDKRKRRWMAYYTNANGKTCHLDYYDTQEAAAHAYNAAISALPPDVQARRNTNPVVDGQLVPRPSSRKRSRAEEPAAAP